MANEKSIQAAILTVSDRASRGAYKDIVGPALADILIDKLGAVVHDQAILPDEQNRISDWLQKCADNGHVDLIITTGGTGFAPRDVTPEATLAILDKQTPGLAEVMRAEALKITPHAMLSRAVAGIRGKTLIINLPGSPKGAEENLGFVLTVIPHAIALLREDRSSEAGHHHSADKRQP